MSSQKQLINLATQQGGYIRTEQLREFESQPTTWRKLSRGDYRAVSDSIVRVLDLPGLEPLLRGAVLALPGAVISHHAAGTIHRFPGVAEKAEVTVPPHSTHRFDRVVVHRADDLRREFVEMYKGLPVTSVARTVFDLAATLPRRRLDHLVEELLVTRAVTLDELARVVAVIGRRGKTGTSAMRDVLQLRGRGDHVPSTVLERMGLAILAAHLEIPDPLLQYPIPWSQDRRFDLAFPERRLAIEWDSRRWHGALERMDADRRRDRECAAHGWVLLRFTWADVKEQPDQVAASVLDVLSQRRRSKG